jgi:hypothetical protein
MLQKIPAHKFNLYPHPLPTVQLQNNFPALHSHRFVSADALARVRDLLRCSDA